VKSKEIVVNEYDYVDNKSDAQKFFQKLESEHLRALKRVDLEEAILTGDNIKIENLRREYLDTK
jgi:3-deoxy-D-manno-octulosonate 8-phosphate phosphatase KdsC-like HAD superfamily phosphatase